MTERTTAQLQKLLEEDGRFRVVLSRREGKGASIAERNQKIRRYQPDVMLSIHGNASEEKQAHGFEVYPSPPGFENHAESFSFAKIVAEEMGNIGARLRGDAGIRFGYYTENGEKVLVDSSDTKIYDYPTFGVLTNMDCPAVLIEQCFITNAADVEEFGSQEGCEKAAAAYYRAICRYLEGLEEAKKEKTSVQADG